MIPLLLMMIIMMWIMRIIVIVIMIKIYFHSIHEQMFFNFCYLFLSGIFFLIRMEAGPSLQSDRKVVKIEEELLWAKNL